MELSKGKSLTFIYGLTSKIFVDLIGRLMLAELIALIFFPFNSVQSLITKNRLLKKVFWGLIILLISLMISDYVNNSSPEDYLRGWAVIVFAIVSIVFLTRQLLVDANYIMYYLIGLFIANLLFQQGNIDVAVEEIKDNYFKAHLMGFMNPLVIIIGALLFKINRAFPGLLFLGFYAILCFVLGARSNGLVFLFGTFLLSIKLFDIRLTKLKMVFLFLILGGTLYSGYLYYVDKVLNEGFGGKNAITQLNQANNPYNPFELLYYGRPEIVVSTFAIGDAIVFGHGSWAKDRNQKYARIFNQVMDGEANYSKDFIPGHSIVINSWLWGGLLGFLSMSYLVIILLRNYVFVYNKSPLNYIVVILTLSLIQMGWHFLFSPFGHLRTSLPIVIALLVVSKRDIENYMLNNSNKIKILG